MKKIKALFCKNKQFAYTTKFMVKRPTGGFSPIDDAHIVDCFSWLAYFSFLGVL